MIAIMIVVRWNLIVVWICVSLIAKDVEYFFHVFFGHLYFFENCSFAHLLMDYLFFWCLTFQVLYIFWILIQKARWIVGKEWVEFQSVGYLFTLLIVSFAVKKLLNLIQSYLWILAHISWAVGVLFRPSLPVPRSWSIPLSTLTHIHTQLTLCFSAVWHMLPTSINLCDESESKSK
jgi:hypothetical protein